MKSSRLFLLVCLTLLPADSWLYIGSTTHSAKTIDHQEHSIFPTPTHRNFTKNYKTTVTRKRRYIPTFLSVSEQNPEDFSWKDSQVLTTLLLSIIRAELSQCILGIVWDSVFAGSGIINSLSLLPNVKQVWHINA